MTVVSPYPHWHYFDAYGPGKLKAVYRGNGIPLPWGNMRQVNDPCQHWAVFRRLSEPSPHSSAQISLLKVKDEARIYCCESVNMVDPAGNNRVLCAGIDLNPAIAAQGITQVRLPRSSVNSVLHRVVVQSSLTEFKKPLEVLQRFSTSIG